MAFDLSNPVSFKNSRSWITSIYRQLGDVPLPKVLVGNKLDLVEATGDFVSSEEARKLAADHQMDYFEVSATQGRNVDEMMNSVITQVFQAKIKPLTVQTEGEGLSTASNFKLGQQDPS